MVLLFLLSFLFSNSAVSADYFYDQECLNYTVYPVQYELILYPQIYEEVTPFFDCDLTITVIANGRHINKIELDAKYLEIQTNSIQVLQWNQRNILENFDIRDDTGKIILFLREEMEPYSIRKTQYQIKMRYRKKMRENDDGIFIVPYQENGHRSIAVVTRLSPNKAKYFFPCFDNYSFEAVFKYEVRLPKNRMDYGNNNMVTADTLKTEWNSNYKIIQYKSSPQIAIYQAGFHSSNFSQNIQVVGKDSGDNLVFWAQPTTLPKLDFITKFSGSMLNVISEYSKNKRRIVNGIINVVAVPANLNNYESGSWNLLTIGEHKLTYENQKTSIQQKEEIMFLMAQQLARIWLGNPGEEDRTRWIQEWFKEGMATYFGYYFMSKTGQSCCSMPQYGLEMRNKAMSVDWLHETPSLESFKRTLAVLIPSRYQQLVTMKTGSLIWMMENALGSERFHQALVKYLNSCRGKQISVEDFKMFLDQETVNCNFHIRADVFNHWIKQPGYPVVYVDVHRHGRVQEVISLQQKQFSFNGRPQHNHKYIIPVTYIKQYSDSCCNYLAPKFLAAVNNYTFKENLNGGWIILNSDASGYYRINYDPVTWKLIISTLRSKENSYRINTISRAQIMNDAFALYMSGDIDRALAEEVVGCLAAEDSPLVWDSAVSGFQLLRVDGAFLQMNSQLYAEWKVFMASLLPYVYNKVINNNDEKSRMFRSRIMSFACYVHYCQCLRTHQQQIHTYLYPADLRQTKYYLQTINSEEQDIKTYNRFDEEDLRESKHISNYEMRLSHRTGVAKSMSYESSCNTHSSLTRKIVETNLRGRSAPGERMSAFIVIITVIALVMGR